MNDEWIQKQVNKYSKSNFGETEQVVDKNTIAWQTLCKYAKPRMTFLDLGCNNGKIVHEMKQKGLHAIGIDLQEVIDKIKYEIDFQVMNLEQDFPDGIYDIIFMRETIEHLHNYEQVCRNIIKALSPNGIAIITGPHSKDDFGEHCPEHVRIFQNNELKELIERSGGKIIESFRETVCRSIGHVVCRM